MEQFDSSEEAISRVLEQQQRNDEQQCPSCAEELTETSVWTTVQLSVCLSVCPTLDSKLQNVSDYKHRR